VPALAHMPFQYRFALAGTAVSRIRVPTVLGFRAEPEAQVEVLRRHSPGVTAALSTAAQEVGRHQSRHVRQSVSPHTLRPPGGPT
jgi:hypothetical protein